MSPAGPDERLRRAAAVVFVDDLATPTCGPEDAHHLLDVLRLEAGTEVAASDGRGRFRLCRLHPAGGRGRGHQARGALLEPLGEVLDDGPPPVDAADAPAGPLEGDEPTTVAFALIKGERTEWAVQKLTELGVQRIVPVVTARTVVRLDAPGALRRAERLRRVAREAASQARRTTLPEVAIPTRLDRYLAEGTLDGLPAPAPGAVALAEPGGDGLADATRCVVVGPEGGFTPEELGLARLRLGLGRNVLRAETAAIVAGILLTRAR